MGALTSFPSVLLLSAAIVAFSTHAQAQESSSVPTAEEQPAPGPAPESEAPSPQPAPASAPPEDESMASPSPAASPTAESGAAYAPSDSLEAARAQEREQEAKAAFRRGDRQYLEGNYQGAVESFERAYALSGRIEMLFNLANAHERLGNYSEAGLALRGYIPHAPTTHRDALEKRLDRLEVLADAQRQPTAPTQTSVVIREPQRAPVAVGKSIGIGLLTLGGAGIVAGTAFAISAANTRAELRNLCESGDSGRLCPPDAENLIRRDRAHSIVADVAIISGLALGATGLYLVLRRDEDQGTEVRAALGPGSVRVGGSF